MIVPNNIYLGDCLELMKEIPDGSVDLILCDLPYGTTACSWDIIIPLNKLWEQYNRIRKPNTAILLFGAQPFSSLVINSNIRDFKQELIWDKQIGGNFVHAKRRILPRHENILLFYSKPPTYNPIMIDKEKSKIRPNPTMKSSTITETIPMGSGIIKCSKDRDKTKSFPTSILSFSKRMAECNEKFRLHPTQKPVSLLEYLIKTYTNEGDLVLDNCAGSGSTLIAAKNLGRQYIGIEKEEKYFEIAKKRLE